MSTPNNNNQGGADAPGGETVEIGSEMMSDVAKKLGVNVAIPEDTGSGAEDDEGEGDAGDNDEGAAGAGDDAGDDNQGDEADAGESDDNDQGEDEEGEDNDADEGEEGADESEEGDADEGADKKDDPAKAEKAAAAKEITTKLKDLPPEARKRAQEVLDGVIARVVIKERGESTRLGKRVEELTTELETTQKAKGPTIVGSVNPVFMADDAAAIDEREEQIEQFERWAARNANGANLPDSEGYDEKKPSFTAEQIEARLTDLLHEKKKILPAARANLQKRGQIDKALRDIYPAIFDPKSAEYAQVQQVLKVLPELKQFADYRVIALKQILGDRALAELLKQRKESPPKGRNSNQPGSGQPRKSPPRAPGSGSPAKGGALPQRGGKPAAPEAVKKFAQDPTRKTLASVALDMMTGE